MKEKPILFSGPMVRAILEGRKTMTRRVVKNLRDCSEVHHAQEGAEWRFAKPDFIYRNGNWFCRFCGNGDDFPGRKGIRCPYGVPGDRLWVRETFAEVQPYYGPGEEIPDWVNYIYRADFLDFDDILRLGPKKWRPSIFMPRAASRILLEVTDVRVERLQDITEADARAEGVEPDVDAGYWKGYIFPGVYDSAKKSFASLWQSINGLGSWDQNPWVWIVSFKRIES